MYRSTGLALLGLLMASAAFAQDSTTINTFVRVDGTTDYANTWISADGLTSAQFIDPFPADSSAQRGKPHKVKPPKPPKPEKPPKPAKPGKPGQPERPKR